MKTTYRGPTTIEAIRCGDLTVRLARPTEPDRLLDDPEVTRLNRESDYMPYWAYLWPGAHLLASFVAGRAWPRGLAAIELGCGLGLAGLAGALRGLRVTFTDYDDAPLDYVRRSAEANGLDPSLYATALVDWREPPADRFGLILAADVLYERRLVPVVARAIAAILAPGGEALVADPGRSSAEDFPRLLAELGLEATTIPLADDLPGHGPTRGTLYRATRPAGP